MLLELRIRVHFAAKPLYVLVPGVVLYLFLSLLRFGVLNGIFLGALGLPRRGRLSCLTCFIAEDSFAVGDGL